VGVGYFASHCCGGEYWEVAIGPVKRGEDIDVVRSVELAEIICHDQQLVRGTRSRSRHIIAASINTSIM